LRNGTNLIAVSIPNGASSSDTYLDLDAGLDLDIIPFDSKWDTKYTNFVCIELFILWFVEIIINHTHRLPMILGEQTTLSTMMLLVMDLRIHIYLLDGGQLVK
jgi:hypothetical protein